MNEFLEFVKKFAGTMTSDEAAQVATALKGNAATQPIFQAAFDLGHGSATRDHNRRLKEIEKERDEAKTALATLQTEFDEFKTKTPNVVEIENKYKEEIKKAEKKVTDLQTAHKQERISWFKDQAKASVVQMLVKRGVDPEWAEYLMSKPENDARLRVVEGEDGKPKVEILKSGSEVTTLQAEKPFDAFADELRKDIKPQYIISNAEGGGTGERGGSSGTSNVFDKVREETKTQVAATTRPEGFKSGAERLGAI